MYGLTRCSTSRCGRRIRSKSRWGTPRFERGKLKNELHAPSYDARRPLRSALLTELLSSRATRLFRGVEAADCINGIVTLSSVFHQGLAVINLTNSGSSYNHCDVEEGEEPHGVGVEVDRSE